MFPSIKTFIALSSLCHFTYSSPPEETQIQANENDKDAWIIPIDQCPPVSLAVPENLQDIMFGEINQAYKKKETFGNVDAFMEKQGIESIHGTKHTEKSLRNFLSTRPMPAIANALEAADLIKALETMKNYFNYMQKN